MAQEHEIIGKHFQCEVVGGTVIAFVDGRRVVVGDYKADGFKPTDEGEGILLKAHAAEEAAVVASADAPEAPKARKSSKAIQE